MKNLSIEYRAANIGKENWPTALVICRSSQTRFFAQGLTSELSPVYIDA